MKSSYNNNKFKTSAPKWGNKFELPNGSYSISDIQDYFEYILEKHNENIDNLSIRIYVNKIENRITFKIKNGYYLGLSTPETMKLLGNTESKINNESRGTYNVNSQIKFKSTMLKSSSVIIVMHISLLKELLLLITQLLQTLLQIILIKS